MQASVHSRLVFGGVAFAMISLFTACSERLVFPDWTIPVPEDTRVVEYADATEQQRSGNHIDVVDDLVIAARPGDDNYAFYTPSDVHTDSAGNIYVLDGGNVRVQVFDAGGEYLRTLGQSGSGPGEFHGNQGGFITVLSIVAGDRLVAYDMSQARISVWGSDGRHEGDHVVPELRFGPLLAGLDDGSFVAVTTERDDERSLSAVIRISGVGERATRYVGLPRPDNLRVGDIAIVNPSGRPVFAADHDGSVYASAGNQYQILAFGADGAARWALRVAHQPARFTDDDRQRILERLRERTPELDAGDTSWPSHLAAISRLAVDGHGHLYVFGAEPPFGPTPAEEGVDVYARGGERLFTGTMPPIRWTDANGDFVYAVRTNPRTEEREIVRSRLVEPFSR